MVDELHLHQHAQHERKRVSNRRILLKPNARVHDLEKDARKQCRESAQLQGAGASPEKVIPLKQRAPRIKKTQLNHELNYNH